MKKFVLVVGFMVALAIVVFMVNKNRDNASAPSAESDIVKRTRFLMDTFCTIKVPATEQNIEPAIEAAFNRMEEVDKKFNCVNPASPIYDFNINNKPITAPEIVGLLETALKICRESGGAFDITVEPLVRLWNFYSDNPQLPSKERIEETLKLVGYQQIKIENNKVTKEKEDVHIDLGAIAKGYALQECVNTLKKNGLKAALIEAGGQVYVFGKINDGVWQIGVRNPRGSGIFAGLGLVDDMGIATSGDYERCFEENGQRYHHLLDPKTGYPAEGIMSLSVIMQDPILADGYSTALFVMGAAKAMKFAETRPEMDLIIVTADGNVQHTKNLENRFIKKK